MKKVFVFWMILAVAVAVVASVPNAPLMEPLKMRYAESSTVAVTPQRDATDAYVQGDENGLIAERPGGRNPLDVEDVLLFTDSLEGTYPAWTSADLAVGDFWHLEGFNALGGSGNAFRCSDSRLASICPASNGGYNNHWLQYIVFDAVDLSSASSPQFAFQAWWKVEPLSGGYPAGFDAWDAWDVWVSTDGGTNWSVLTPSSPAYNCASAFSFGDEWNMGPGIAAYSDSSADYVTCVFPLSAYVGQSNVKVRVAFCSDPSFCSIDNGSGVPQCNRFGLVVDSVRISDGASTLFSNDGAAGGWTTATGPQSPDSWSYDTSTNHSPTHCWTAAVLPNESRGIYSYDVILPATYQQLKMSYWVWCDMPDFEGPDTDTFLEDYYKIMISTNGGATWTQTQYDYATNDGEAAPGGNSLTGWVRRTLGLSGGAYQPLLLFSRVDASLPETLKVAFEQTTDGNDDGGAGGTGLHVDDVEFHGVRAQAIDLSTRNIVVPYPTTVGLARPWTFDFVNEGLNALSPVRGKLQFTRPDGTTLPAAGDSTIVSAGALNYGETRTIARTWLNPDQVGAWRIRTIANATGELDRTNDTARTAVNTVQNDDSSLAVYVRAANTYELGYGRRSVGSAYLNPRYIHFTPLADGVPAANADTIDITQLRVMWRFDSELADSGGRIRFDFWQEGPDTFHTGALINSIVTRIDTSETIGAGGFIHWWELDLTTTPGLSNRTGNFWVSATPLDTFDIAGTPTPAPLPLGISPAGVTPDGHTYFLDVPTNTLTQSGGRLLFDVIVRPTQTSTPDPVNNLTINRQSTTSDIRLTWGPSARANGYFVWRLTSPTQAYNTGTLLTTLPITATTFIDTGAVGLGSKFFYVVIATN